MVVSASGQELRKRWIVGLTGASGAVYGIRMIEELLLRRFEVHAVVTEAGWRVLKEELGWETSRRAEALERAFPGEASPLRPGFLLPADRDRPMG